MQGGGSKKAAGALEWEGTGAWGRRARQGPGRGRSMTRGMDQGCQRGMVGVGAWEWEGTSTGAWDGAEAWDGTRAW